MTCKFERFAGNNGVVLRACGRIEVEHVSMIEELIGKECRVAVLDLTELMLVGRDVVTFLCSVRPGGRRLKHSSDFVKEWIAKEQLRVAHDFRGC
jgi:hypothetical protein